MRLFPYRTFRTQMNSITFVRNMAALLITKHVFKHADSFLMRFCRFLIIFTSILPSRLFSLTCKIYNKTLGVFLVYTHIKRSYGFILSHLNITITLFVLSAYSHQSDWTQKILLCVCLYVCVSNSIRRGWKVVNVLYTSFHNSNGDMNWEVKEYCLFCRLEMSTILGRVVATLWQDSRLFSDNWTCY